MDKFTPDFIRKQLAIAEKATPRPWAFYDAYDVVGKPGIVGSHRLGTDDVTVIEASPYGYNEINVIKADAEYLHAAANNYPAALAEIARLRKKVERARVLFGLERAARLAVEERLNALRSQYDIWRELNPDNDNDKEAEGN